jgi:hypothetical protein
MAAFDIMPFKSPHGGTTSVRYGSMTASEVFDTGEPIMLVTAGTLTEPTDNAAQWTVAQNGTGQECGIACFGPAGGAQTNDRAAAINPQTGVAFTALDEIAYWPANEGTIFITSNFWAAGAGSAVAPDLANIGIAYQITYATFGTPDSGWGVEETAGVVGVDVQAVILDVLDSNKAPISRSGNAGVYVIFEIKSTLAAA